jgi:hypothetical protein
MLFVSIFHFDEFLEELDTLMCFELAKNLIYMKLEHMNISYDFLLNARVLTHGKNTLTKIL